MFSPVKDSEFNTQVIPCGTVHSEGGGDER
jgi:hypothetical protein